LKFLCAHSILSSGILRPAGAAHRVGQRGQPDLDADDLAQQPVDVLRRRVGEPPRLRLGDLVRAGRPRGDRAHLLLVVVRAHHLVAVGALRLRGCILGRAAAFPVMGGGMFRPCGRPSGLCARNERCDPSRYTHARGSDAREPRAVCGQARSNTLFEGIAVRIRSA